MLKHNDPLLIQINNLNGAVGRLGALIMDEKYDEAAVACDIVRSDLAAAETMIYRRKAGRP